MEGLWRRGDRGSVVADLRATLTRLGYTLSATTDPELFDDELDHAVRSFQQSRGLRVDGNVGPQTYRALDEARWQLGDRTLGIEARLMRGDDVAALQSRLLTMGFDIGRLDGIFGPRTENGVREFQKSVGIPVDGVAGPDTFAALNRLARTVSGGAAHVLREHHALHSRGSSLVGRVIVIDPGHGGDDHGISAHDLQESEVNFDIARRLEGRLAALGVTVFLTRGKDQNPDDGERAEFANQTGADLMIALHVDGLANPEAQGVSTYFYGHDAHGFDSPTGERLAELLLKEICARTAMRDCRTHPKTWELLRRTKMPAIRIDTGYLTNAHDAAILANQDFRDHIAEAIAIAIQRLYLPVDSDALTGALRLNDLR